jgi:hypothetical protein
MAKLLKRGERKRMAGLGGGPYRIDPSVVLTNSVEQVQDAGPDGFADRDHDRENANDDHAPRLRLFVDFFFGQIDLDLVHDEKLLERKMKGENQA